MDTRRTYIERRASRAPSTSTQARLEIISMEISTVMTQRRETTDEELELIEMRYRQALALKNVEELCAEGPLDCM
jgi:hypothetical protein